MESYQQHTLESASAVDLVVALYDGMIRFLYAAGDAVDRGDEAGRRVAVKRALDIIIHLQARPRQKRSASFTRRFSRRSCKPLKQLHERNSTTPSNVSATSATPGDR